MLINKITTSKILAVESVKELQKMVNDPSINLDEVSRMAIDNLIKKFFNKTPKGNKSMAIDLLKGLVNGNDPENIMEVPDLTLIRKGLKRASKSNKHKLTSNISEEDRLSAISSIIEKMAADKFSKNAGDGVYYKRLLRTKDLKVFSMTEDDILKVTKDNPKIVTGIDMLGDYYVMLRDKEWMDYWRLSRSNRYL